MAFDGSEGGAITLTVAASYTENYRNNHPDEILSHFIGSESLKSLLEQGGSMGVRIYYGEDDKGDKKLVFVSADADEEDDLSLIIDMTKEGPPYSASANALNS